MKHVQPPPPPPVPPSPNKQEYLSFDPHPYVGQGGTRLEVGSRLRTLQNRLGRRRPLLAEKAAGRDGRWWVGENTSPYK